RPPGLELEQEAKLLVRSVERLDLEAATILGRHVDPPEREVAGNVLDEVDELEPGANVVAQCDRFFVVEPAQDTEHQASAGIRRVDAVVLDVGPRLVLGDPLIHPVRLDQPEKGLARQLKLAKRRLQLDEHGPGRGPGEGRINLAFELIQRREPSLGAALELVTEHVDEPRVRVERADMRAQLTRECERGNREVLSAGTVRDRSDVEHRQTIAVRGPRAQLFYQDTSRRAPARIPRRAASPAGSSMTAFAPLAPAVRHGLTLGETFSTSPSRERKTASMGKRMKNM